MTTAFIFANGDFPHPDLIAAQIAEGDLLIAADAGFDHIQHLGLIPHIVIGDLDSISETTHQYLADNQIPTLRFPPEKDETDLELCIQYAIDQQADHIVITGAFGGRIDQMLGNILTMLNPQIKITTICLDDGITEAFFIQQKASIKGNPGDTISLIPWGREVTNVTTMGLQYPLVHESLFPYLSRSISNVMLADECTIGFDRGDLLCVHIRNI